MQPDLRKPTPGIGLFVVFVFVLTAIPKLNIKIGPLPVYIIDLIILALIFVAQSRPLPVGRRPFAGTIIALLVLAILSEIGGILTFGTLQESV